MLKYYISIMVILYKIIGDMFSFLLVKLDLILFLNIFELLS